jgi:hypothetical protein
MQADPIQEWQRLTEHYRQMSDEELRDLTIDFSDLTETAKQALRGEMRSRGLGDPEDANKLTQGPPQGVLAADIAPSAPDSLMNRTATALGVNPDAPELVPDNPNVEEDVGPYEYTWKTLLCECETSEEARQLSEVLKRAGIESWIENPARYSRYTMLDVTNPRVLVAADQLDQARAIAEQPIPREIVEESAGDVPEFTSPKCPKCRAEDPVLESVNPVNTWRCEQCGEEWSDENGTEVVGSAGPR